MCTAVKTASVIQCGLCSQTTITNRALLPGLLILILPLQSKCSQRFLVFFAWEWQFRSDRQLFLRPRWICIISCSCLINVEISYFYSRAFLTNGEISCFLYLSRKRRDVYLAVSRDPARTLQVTQNNPMNLCNLHFKCLLFLLILPKVGMDTQILVTTPNMKFHENLSGGSRVVPHGQTDIMQLSLFFLNKLLRMFKMKL